MFLWSMWWIKIRTHQTSTKMNMTYRNRRDVAAVAAVQIRCIVLWANGSAFLCRRVGKNLQLQSLLLYHCIPSIKPSFTRQGMHYGNTIFCVKSRIYFCWLFPIKGICWTWKYWELPNLYIVWVQTSAKLHPKKLWVR